MKKMLAILLVAVLSGCEPPADMGDGWILCGKTPESIGNGIYKKHDDKERVTYYATKVHGGWAVSVVKD